MPRSALPSLRVCLRSAFAFGKFGNYCLRLSQVCPRFVPGCLKAWCLVCPSVPDFFFSSVKKSMKVGFPGFLLFKKSLFFLWIDQKNLWHCATQGILPLKSCDNPVTNLWQTCDNLWQTCDSNCRICRRQTRSEGNAERGTTPLILKTSIILLLIEWNYAMLTHSIFGNRFTVE